MAEERPSGEEISEAIERWRCAKHESRQASSAEAEARVALVDLLHRAGLNGFSL